VSVGAAIKFISKLSWITHGRNAGLVAPSTAMQTGDGDSEQWDNGKDLAEELVVAQAVVDLVELLSNIIELVCYTIICYTYTTRNFDQLQVT
jgi:hypothetical protein